jgi:hypothetical protein
MTWKSTSQDQQEILSAIEALHVPDGFEADCTYGNGDAARLREALRGVLTFDARYDKPDCFDRARDENLFGDGILAVPFDTPLLGRDGPRAATNRAETNRREQIARVVALREEARVERHDSDGFAARTGVVG